MPNAHPSDHAGQGQAWTGFLIAMAIFIAVGALFADASAPGALIFAEVVEATS